MAEGRALWQVKPFIVFFPAIFLCARVVRARRPAAAGRLDRVERLLDPKATERRAELLAGRPPQPRQPVGRRGEVARAGDHPDRDPATWMSNWRCVDQPGAVIADRRPGFRCGCHDVGFTAKSEMAPCSTPHFSSSDL
jgi:hypothetical protein